jgi:hypothetical protein
MNTFAKSAANDYATAVEAYAANLHDASEALACYVVGVVPIGVHSTTWAGACALARDCFILRGGDPGFARVLYAAAIRRV